ncbi:hypothetical protein B5K06_31355 [Rhizobium grahamii]|uniref:Uncharacterized protein n=1 Tax=Rhizobium grahamii TaxID=1120045 RepID=A0A370KF90_9HYPH|nr:hypothetical protein B5K06_31355 [Rhizobium grahamii]
MWTSHQPSNLVVAGVALVQGAGHSTLNIGGFTLDGITTATIGAMTIYTRSISEIAGSNGTNSGRS